MFWVGFLAGTAFGVVLLCIVSCVIVAHDKVDLMLGLEEFEKEKQMESQNKIEEFSKNL